MDWGNPMTYRILDPKIQNDQRELWIDFGLIYHELIHIPVWYINNFTIIKTLKTQTFALQCKIDPSTTLLECKIGPSTTLLECKIGPSTMLLSFTRKSCV